eukprot:1773938-Prymnesium_polylepis.1
MASRAGADREHAGAARSGRSWACGRTGGSHHRSAAWAVSRSAARSRSRLAAARSHALLRPS